MCDSQNRFGFDAKASWSFFPWVALAFGLRSSSSYMLVYEARPDFVTFRSKFEISNECFDTSPTSKLSSNTTSKDGSVSVTRLDSSLKMISFC
jgi:hypothetical protein